MVREKIDDRKPRYAPEEHYRGFICSWIDPPPTGVGSQMNISSKTVSLRDVLDASETERPNFQSLEEAKENARRAIGAALARFGR
jgi:hypothetical protein